MLHKKYLFFAFILIDAVMLGLIAWKIQQRATMRAALQATPATSVEELAATSTATIMVRQTIVYGDSVASLSAELTVPPRTSVLSVLQKTQSVETKHYDFGDLVESVDGRKNGTDQKYWTFKVNGVDSPVGAGAYQLQAGDQIEWKFGIYEK